jgi:hypothetical protein
LELGTPPGGLALARGGKEKEEEEEEEGDIVMRLACFEVSRS